MLLEKSIPILISPEVKPEKYPFSEEPEVAQYSCSFYRGKTLALLCVLPRNEVVLRMNT